MLEIGGYDVIGAGSRLRAGRASYTSCLRLQRAAKSGTPAGAPNRIGAKTGEDSSGILLK